MERRFSRGVMIRAKRSNSLVERAGRTRDYLCGDLMESEGEMFEFWYRAEASHHFLGWSLPCGIQNVPKVTSMENSI